MTNTEVSRTVQLFTIHGFRTKNHDEVLEAMIVAKHPDYWAGIANQNRHEGVGNSDALYIFCSIPLRAASEFAVALNNNVGRGRPPNKTSVFAAARHDA